MYKLGVIGVGNMGGAVVRGVLDSKMLDPSEIVLFDNRKEQLKDLLDMGVSFAKSDCDVFSNAKNVFIAVKPQSIDELAKEVKDFIKDDTLIISIVAGKSIQNLKEIFGENHKFIRVMSNTPALVRKGMTAVSYERDLARDDVDFAVNLFKSVGEVTEIDEKDMSVFTGAVGSMPAYVFMFIEAAADAAVSCGMKRKEAYRAIAQTILGSCELFLSGDKHPGELKDQVTSPAGTTIAGVKALEREKFRYAVIEAVEASVKASENIK